jgi:hypothetical protein
MTRPPDRRPRIAASLRDDADRAIEDDLDLWPGINDRLASAGTPRRALRQSTANPNGSHDAWSRPRPGIARSNTRRTNLTIIGSLPALALTFAMIFLLLASYIQPSQRPKNAEPQTATPQATLVDACSLITQQEADGLAGKHLEQYPWKPVKPNWFACSYYSEDESINILLTDFQSEAAMRGYMQTLSANSTSFQANSRFDAGNNYTDDETYTRSRKPGNENLNFWDVIVRYQNRYIILTWMTSKPDPTASLQSLATKVTNRLANP